MFLAKDLPARTLCSLLRERNVCNVSAIVHHHSYNHSFIYTQVSVPRVIIRTRSYGKSSAWLGYPRIPEVEIYLCRHHVTWVINPSSCRVTAISIIYLFYIVFTVVWSDFAPLMIQSCFTTGLLILCGFWEWPVLPFEFPHTFYNHSKICFYGNNCVSYLQYKQ